ncbi:MAG TPA: ABC transporter substrate-binding protein, partial [Anaerovoracaceae bacterium]|nr:ABC transporter substrate-binding protein [Anaerovoracaceae bacterium]
GMKKISLLLAVVLMLSGLLTGCAGGSDGENTLPDKIIIGVFEPLTGTDAEGGKLEKQGIDLAHDLYPNLTLNGKEIPVELAYADNKSDKIESVNAARSLIEDFRAHIVLGSWGSSNSIAAGPVFEKAEIPAIGTSCTNPLVTLGNEYYFRVCFIEPFQGRVMANYAFREGGYKKVAIIQEATGIYSVTLCKLFAEAFRELTGDENSITSIGEYNAGDREFSAQLTAVKNSGAEAIFFPGNYTESALIMKQARELEIDLPFLGGDTWDTPGLIRIAGPAAEGAVYSGAYDPAAPLTGRTTEFLDAFAKKYGQDAYAADVAALGFDAYLLAVETIEKAGSVDGPALRDILAKTEDFEGATGYITLDDNGDAIKPAVIKTIQDGKNVYHSFVEPF